MSMIQTNWKHYREGRTPLRIRAKYGMDYAFAKRHEQDPYFEITGEIERQSHGVWREDSGGMLHAEISRHFPDLKKYLKWHLVGPEGPTHYIANGIYWWKKIGQPKDKPYDPDPTKAFKNTIVFGALSDDQMPPSSWEEPEVRDWLEQRLPDLMIKFIEDMTELGVLE